VKFAYADERSEKITKLIEQTYHSDSKIRHDAIIKLGQLKAAEAIPALEDILDDNDRVNFLAVINALSQIGTEKSAAVLNNIIFYAKYMNTIIIQKSAIRALGAIGKPAKNTIPKLLSILDSQFKEYHPSVLKALGQIGESPENVIPILRSTNWNQLKDLVSDDVVIRTRGLDLNANNRSIYACVSDKYRAFNVDLTLPLDVLNIFQ